MKKLILTLVVLFTLSFAHAAEYGVRTGRTGGTSDDLDGIGAATPSTGDVAFVLDTSNNMVYHYEYDSTATDAEDDPDVIRPDDYSTGGNWILIKVYIGAGEIDTTQLAAEAVTAAKMAATLDLSGKTLTLGNPLYDFTPSSDDTWQGPKSSVTAGESITQWDTIYIKYDTDGPRAYSYDANSTDSDNDTYPPVGIALESDTAGNALSFGFGKGVARNDGWSFTHAQDEGKPVYCSESAAGGIELTAPADTGDHVIRIGTIVEVDNSDNGDVILFNFGFADVTVP